MENGSFWKFEDCRGRGMLATTGAGTLGRGIAGSCGIKSQHSAGEREAAPPGLFKTLSMPMLATHGPCGARVGEDLGMSECGTPHGRRAQEPRRLEGGLEDRLSHLEMSFTGTPQALARPSSTLSSIPGSRLSTGLASRGGVYTSSTNRGLVSRGNLSTAKSMRSDCKTPDSALDGRFRDSSTIGINSSRVSSRGGGGPSIGGTLKF